MRGREGNTTKVALETPSLYKGDFIRVEGKRQKMSVTGCDSSQGTSVVWILIWSYGNCPWLVFKLEGQMAEPLTTNFHQTSLAHFHKKKKLERHFP